MATIAAVPLVLKNYTVKIAADNYEKAVSAVIFTPPGNSQIVWQGPIGVDHYDDSTSGAWTCQIDFVQDWETATSLSRYLFNNDGTEVEAVFIPTTGTGKPTFTADIVLRSGPIGGTTRAFATSSVTMSCTAKPVLGTSA